MMGEYQLGKDIPDQDVALLVDWMKTLTGEIPQEYIAEPDLPPSSEATPKPDPS